ncbi:MAG: hypothetical protein Q8R25_04095 [bacterium]|nr:hypothetical protein [bacterium]
MYTDPTVGGSLSWLLWFLGEVSFKWIPGTVIALTGTGNTNLIGTPPPIAPITAPVTTSDVVNYLASASDPIAYSALYHQWSVYITIVTIVCLAFAAITIYSLLRLRQIRLMERQKFASAAHTVAVHDVPRTHLRWRHILDEIATGAEQHWRLAILEADIMLGELLDTQGYKGETMGDKMRQVDRASFNTIDLAWEAHRVRNRIAHEGMSHLLNEREVRRVIGLYEKVFREFRVIE